jgi:voltage-gated potassium channel
LRTRNWFARIWPHVPIALLVLASGVLGIVTAIFSLHVAGTEQLVAAGTGSLVALGHGTAEILGVALLLSGIGLFWRLQSAWVFSLLISVVTIGVNLGRHSSWSVIGFPLCIFIVLMLGRKAFDRRAVAATYLISIVSILGVLAYGTFGSYIFGNQFAPHITTVLQGLFYTITTLATVGSAYQPATTQTQMFELSLIVVGLGIFTSTIATAFGPVISKEMSYLFDRKKDTAMQSRDHIVLVGEGAIANSTAEELERRKMPFVQVLSSPAGPGDGDDGMVVRGDPLTQTVLEHACVANARMVVTTLNDDSANAMVTLLAKHINPKVRVLAIASSAKAIDPIKLAGADVVFAPSAAGGRLLANLVEGEAIPPQFSDLLNQTQTADR